jgi:hypothetical protein
MTEAEQAAYERGRADERADVVAWLGGRPFPWARATLCQRIGAAWSILRHGNGIVFGLTALLGMKVARREHMKGTDNG